MSEKQLYPYRSTEAIVLVSSYDQGSIEGQLLHSRMQAPAEFHNIPQLLFLLDEFLLWEDRMVCYHAFKPDGLDAIERFATLRIQILFREHHTWQGSVLWEEQQKETSFRSVWELVRILDEILA